MTTGITRGLASSTRLLWRTSWPMLLAVPILLAGLVSATGISIAELYPTESDRLIYRDTLGASPVSVAFNGRGYELDTLGGITACEVGFFGQLAIPVLGLLLAVGLTRRLEESGILELITATRVHRLAVPLAATLSCIISWTLFAILGTLGLRSAGYPLSGSLRYLVILAAFGLCYSSFGLLLGQLASTTRGANGLGLGLLLGLFLARMIIDGRALDLTWATPPGWVAEAHPWGTWVWWPLWAFALVSTVCVVAALLIAARRDLGFGIFAARLGADQAGCLLQQPLGIIWRLTRVPVLGWFAGVWVSAAGIAAMTRSFADAILANEALTMIFGEDADQMSGVVAFLLFSVMSISAGLLIISRMGVEELVARFGLLLAGRVPRWRWWVTWAGFALLVTAALLLTSAAVFGLAQWQVMGQREFLVDALWAGVDYLAPVLMVVSIGLALTSIVPRGRMLAWIMPSGILLIGILGEALQLPDWVLKLSPLQLVGELPLDSPNRWAEAVMGLLAIGIAFVGWLVFTRRDLVRG